MTLRLFIAILLASLGTVRAGDLDPPGTVIETFKDLSLLDTRIPIDATDTPGDDDAVFIINRPGRYKLVGNLTGEAGKVGIRVEPAPEDLGSVDIDVGGFTMSGVPGSLDAIRINEAIGFGSVAVSNGTITGWGEDGIDSLTGAFLEDLTVTGCAGRGIACTDTGRVTNVRVNDNGTFGIAFDGRNVRFTNVSASGNGATGIKVGNRSVCTGCTATSNGPIGIEVGSLSQVIDCTATGHPSTNIKAADNCKVLRCTTADTQFGQGVSTGESCTIEACTADDCSFGIVCGAASECVDCTTRRCDAGIQGFSSFTCRGCTVTDTNFEAIIASDGCHIEDCNVIGTMNSEGIVVSGRDVVVRGNRVEGCFRGIASYGGLTDGSVIIDNQCDHCLMEGFWLFASGATLVRNRACGNNGGGAQYSIAAGNKAGAITSDPTTAGPWDNFEF
ncbi:MAG: hypothetical protein KDA21_11095 [Phycisphaerales bacterium]|nr:hypothetical protein [Phycisphaerales bacterium]